MNQKRVLEWCKTLRKTSTIAKSAFLHVDPDSDFASILSEFSDQYPKYTHAIDTCIRSIQQSTISLPLLIKSRADLIHSIASVTRNCLIASGKIGYGLTGRTMNDRANRGKELVQKDLYSWRKFENEAAQFSDLHGVKQNTAEASTLIEEFVQVYGAGSTVHENQIIKIAAENVMKLYTYEAQHRNIAWTNDAQNRVTQNSLEMAISSWHLSSGYAHANNWPRTRGFNSEILEFVTHALVFADITLQLWISSTYLASETWDGRLFAAQLDSPSQS